jgi:hypothetical protein
MKKFLKLWAIGFLAFTVANCAVSTSRGRVLFLQRGVILQITHTCTDTAVVYQAGRGQIDVIDGATPSDVVLAPIVPGERTVSVTVQSVGAAGRVTGTYVDTFYIDQYSTTTQTWVIGGSGWTGGGRTSQCPR